MVQMEQPNGSKSTGTDAFSADRTLQEHAVASSCCNDGLFALKEPVVGTAAPNVHRTTTGTSHANQQPRAVSAKSHAQGQHDQQEEEDSLSQVLAAAAATASDLSEEKRLLAYAASVLRIYNPDFHLTPEVLMILRHFFDDLDPFGTGKISKQALLQEIEQLDPEGKLISQETRAKIARAFPSASHRHHQQDHMDNSDEEEEDDKDEEDDDRDDDGITFEEFCEWVMKWKETHPISVQNLYTSWARQIAVVDFGLQESHGMFIVAPEEEEQVGLSRNGAMTENADSSCDGDSKGRHPPGPAEVVPITQKEIFRLLHLRRAMRQQRQQEQIEQIYSSGDANGQISVSKDVAALPLVNSSRTTAAGFLPEMKSRLPEVSVPTSTSSSAKSSSSSQLARHESRSPGSHSAVSEPTLTKEEPKLSRRDTAAMESIFRKQKKESVMTVSKSFLAGGLAGIVAKSALAPVDRVKIMFQVSDQHRFSIKNGIRLGKQIYMQDGFRALFRGNSLTIIRVVPYAGAQHSSFDYFRRKFHAYNFHRFQQSKHRHHGTEEFKQKLSNTQLILAGSLAGTTSLVLTYPLDIVRARYVVQQGKFKYSNLVEAVVEMYRIGGVKSFTRGMLPSLLGTLPYTGIGFSLNEKFKHWAREFYYGDVANDPDPEKLATLTISPFSKFLCSYFAACIAQTITYPIDTVRRRIQTDGFVLDANELGRNRMKTRRYTGIVQTCRIIMVKEGWRGFFKGVSVNWLRSPLATGISLTAYDIFKEVFGVATIAN